MVAQQGAWHIPPLHGADEVLEGGELCAQAPDAEPRHVRHVAGLRGA